MKSKILVLAIITSLSTGVFGQTYNKRNTYIDAKNLSIYYSTGDTANFNRVLRDYKYDPARKNPIMSGFLDPSKSSFAKTKEENEKKQRELGEILMRLDSSYNALSDSIKGHNKYLSGLKSLIETTSKEDKIEELNDSLLRIVENQKDTFAISALIVKNQEVLNSQNNLLKQLEEKRNEIIGSLEISGKEKMELESVIKEMLSKVKELRLSNSRYSTELGIIDSRMNPHTKDNNTKPVVGRAVTSSWQAAAVNGVANFMASRFKQEVIQMTTSQIFNEVNKKGKKGRIEFIFPKTYELVDKFKKNDYSAYYAADLELLRQTAQIDIENLPTNIGIHYDTLFQSKPKTTKDMVRLVRYIVDYSQNGYPVNHLLTAISKESFSDTIRNVLQIADLFSQALLADSGWVNPLNELPTDFKKPEVRYFYGLLYQQLIDNNWFKAYFESKNDDPISIAEDLQELSVFTIRLNNLNDFVRHKNHELRTAEDFISYVKSFNQTINNFATTFNKKIPNIIDNATFNKSTDYLSVMEYTFQGNYQKAISNVLVEFLDEKTENNDKKENFTLIRTLTFLSQLATVQTSGEMENLLKAYALPIGSSSVKRKSSVNLSVNGYVGLTGGWTRFDKMNESEWLNYGLSAPVGLSLTWSNSKKSNFTIFGSIIDVGSIVNQRLINNHTEYADLRLEHFFTPGIGFFYNLPKCPITIGVHGSFVPNFKTVEYTVGTGENAKMVPKNENVLRLNLSLLVDIPFFTLYNK
ncbi:MAG: hypothetical protein LBI82_11030 [Dysgonamonadaceae bacterium]|jgi:hypothetical protein|nr:hypothetical protein [Dysgonamonadaceae bacterium]